MQLLIPATLFTQDILTEDYLEEAHIYNTYVRSLAISNDSAVKQLKPMPSVDLYSLLNIPHKVRLDLSVVLTATILFHVPGHLLVESLTIMLSKYMSLTDITTLHELPLFVRTAIVSILRRVTRKELEEHTLNQQKLAAKPSRAEVCMSADELNHLPLPTFTESSGFNFLRPIKRYLASALPDNLSTSQHTEFSELEYEILKKLPDTPTAAHGNDYLTITAKNCQSVSYKDWISFASRHTVLILNKAPSCPSLTRPQTSVAAQETYFELLPLLRAANMTLQDLDMEMTGVGKDGRSMPSSTTVIGTRVIVCQFQ